MFSKWRMIICLSGLLLSLVILAACNQTKETIGDNKVISDDGTSAVFGVDDIINALPTTISESIELVGIDLNNEEINIEGEPAPEEDDSELSPQAVLPGALGWLVYYRFNQVKYEIWTADQVTDAKTKVWSGPDAVQSVAVSGDGNWVAASIINSSGKYDIYLFDVAGNHTYQLTNTSNKDELDVSMTADGSKIAYSQPTNAGLSKIKICDYDAVANSCSISTLGSTQNQRQASITGNGKYVALIRDINPGVRWRVLLFNMTTNTYTIVITRSEELSHPSANHDGTLVMYLRDRTSTIGKYLVRIKNLMTNVINNELSKPDLDHPHMTPNADFFTYKDIANGWYRAFTRNIATNARASAHGGNWNYYAPYWGFPQVGLLQLTVEGLLGTVNKATAEINIAANGYSNNLIFTGPGNKEIHLPIGTYTITPKHVEHHNTPLEKIVVIKDGTTSTISLLYTLKPSHVLLGTDKDDADNTFIQPIDETDKQHMEKADILLANNTDTGDLFFGILGRDTLVGGAWDDVLVGGPENFVGPNSDAIRGNAGDDINIWVPGDGSDAFIGDKGKDVQIFGPFKNQAAPGAIPTLFNANGREIPQVTMSQKPQFTCQIEVVPANQDLGYQFLIRFAVNGDVKVTVRVKDVEWVICPSANADTVKFADLTQSINFSEKPLNDFADTLLGEILQP